MISATFFPQQRSYLKSTKIAAPLALRCGMSQLHVNTISNLKFLPMLYTGICIALHIHTFVHTWCLVLTILSLSYTVFGGVYYSEDQ